MFLKTCNSKIVKKHEYAINMNIPLNSICSSNVINTVPREFSSSQSKAQQYAQLINNSLGGKTSFGNSNGYAYNPMYQIATQIQNGLNQATANNTTNNTSTSTPGAIYISNYNLYLSSLENNACVNPPPEFSIKCVKAPKNRF